MEKKLSSVLSLSLKETSLRRTAIFLWCRSDIISELDVGDVESKVEDNMKKLALPPLLKEQMKYLVKPIGSELRNWKKFHEVYFQIENINMICMLKHLCWTNLGNLDYRITAENLIRHETFDTVTLYRLACVYCLDEYIPILWEKLSEERKKYFYKEEGPLELTEPRLEFCWPYILKGEETRLDYVLLNPFEERPTFNQCAFEYSANKGNKAAAEYFFRKLPYDVRADSLDRLCAQVLIRGTERRFEEYSDDDFPEGKTVDVFFFLFSLMKPEEQMEIFEKHGSKILVCFLDWPWREFFLDTAELFSDFFNAKIYYSLLIIIFWLIKRKGFDLTKLFQNCFLRGSSDFINVLMENEPWCVSMLIWFVDVGDSETIKIFFSKLNSVQRRTLVSYRSTFQCFCVSIKRGKWPMVELCLLEATLSKESKDELKQLYTGFFTDVNLNDMSLRKRIWKQFLHFFDENGVKIASKRKSEEEESKCKTTALKRNVKKLSARNKNANKQKK